MVQKSFGIALFSFFLTGNLFCQNLTFYGFLPVINQTGKVSKKINYNLFLSSTIDAFKETEYSKNYPPTDLQLYIQPSIIYVSSSRANFAASYTYQRNNPFNNAFSNEHRFWQQAIFSFNLPKGKLTNRFRFEERFIQNKTTMTYPLSTRIRYQMGMNMPLQGKTLDQNEFYLNMYNEFYFSLIGNKNATYSENWSYLGIGYDLGKFGKFECGYLLQFLTRNKAKDLRILNLAQIGWITNFNFHLKKN